MRKTTKIEVGMHEDMIGVSIHIEDGTKESHLFSIDVAENLAWNILALAEEAKKKGARPTNAPLTSKVGVSENVNVKISGGDDEIKVKG